MSQATHACRGNLFRRSSLLVYGQGQLQRTGAGRQNGFPFLAALLCPGCAKKSTDPASPAQGLTAAGRPSRGIFCRTGEFNVTVNRLIEHNERDLQRLRKNVSVLKGRPGTEQFIGEFERQIVEISSVQHDPTSGCVEPAIGGYNEQACAAGSRCTRCRIDERISPKIQSESRSLYARSVRELENSRTYFSGLQFILISPVPGHSECHPQPGRDRAEGEEMRAPRGRSLERIEHHSHWPWLPTPEPGPFVWRSMSPGIY